MAISSKSFGSKIENENDPVKQGVPIAVMGKAGNTEAVHLHLMVSTSMVWPKVDGKVNYQTTTINVNPYDTHLIKNSGRYANDTLEQISAEADGQTSLPYWTESEQGE